MLLTEMTILTALRTAATSALAATHLAPPGARTMAHHRQRRAVRVPGARLQGAARHRPAAALRHRPARQRQMRGATWPASASTSRSAPRRRRRWKAPRSSPRSPPTSRTPRSSPTTWSAPASTSTPSAATARARPSCTPDILRRADIFVEYPPQTRIEGEIQQIAAGPSGDRALAGDRRARCRAARDARADHAVRLRRLRHRGFLGAALRPRA